MMGGGPQEAVIEDLGTFERAEGYCRWLAEFMTPTCGRRIVELGSGTGNLTRYLLEGTERAWLLEADPRLCGILRERFAGRPVEVIQVDLNDGIPPALARTLREQRINTIVSSNVLEHLRDDLGVLRQAYEILAPGGYTQHIVPAQPWLFNRLDRAYGHLRRTTKGRILAAARDQRWIVERLQYINLSGMVGWALSHWTASNLTSRKVMLFQRYCLPVERMLARRWRRMPLGLSLFFCLRKG